MYRQSLRGALASSIKYLRQSSWPNFAAAVTQPYFTHQISFVLQRNISRCLCDHFLLLYCRFFFRLSRRFHFVEKKSKTVEVSFNSSCLHASFSSYGQSLEKQYFSISRLPLCAAAVIVHSSHSQCFTSLAHLRNSSLFVPATSAQNQA